MLRLCIELRERGEALAKQRAGQRVFEDVEQQLDRALDVLFGVGQALVDLRCHVQRASSRCPFAQRGAYPFRDRSQHRIFTFAQHAQTRARRVDQERSAQPQTDATEGECSGSKQSGFHHAASRNFRHVLERYTLVSNSVKRAHRTYAAKLWLLRVRWLVHDACGHGSQVGKHRMHDANDEEEITLPSGLVLDLVDECRHLGAVASPLLKMTKHLDPERAQERCSIDLFNDASDWIERELGMTTVRLAGRQIGRRMFAAIRALGLHEAPSTMELMRELESASRTVFYDPDGHGWDLIRHDAHSAVLRNTQETNCVLSEGMLLALMDRTPAKHAQVRQVTCCRRGDDSCDYEIVWNA